MTEINHSNYEIFFLDYLEGRLNQQQIAELRIFLEAHPDLKEEMEGLEPVSLAPDESVIYNGKEMLKRPMIMPVGRINERNYEEFFIAAEENDLSGSEKTNLERFLVKNPLLQNEYDLISKSRIQPDRSIVFPDKASLKKTFIIPFAPRLIYYGAAVAATLLLLIGLKFIFVPSNPNEEDIMLTEIPVKESVHEVPEMKNAAQIQEINPEMNGKNSRPHNTSNEYEAEMIAEQNTHTHVVGQHIAREMQLISTLAALPATIRIENSANGKTIDDTREYFSKYFHDIALAQQIRHIESSGRGITATRLLAQGSNIVNEIFQPREEERSLLPGQIDLWKIADVGINGFAKVTGADMEFRRQHDEQGNITAFAFESQSMQINRSLRKDK